MVLEWFDEDGYVLDRDENWNGDVCLRGGKFRYTEDNQGNYVMNSLCDLDIEMEK